MECIVEHIEDLNNWEIENLPSSIICPSEIQQTEVHRVVLLVNPVAGAQKGLLTARWAEVLLGKAGIWVETHELERRGHAEHLLAELSLKDVDVVCILGGDGTFHECVNGWLKRPEKSLIPLSMIPGGTGNSFSLELQGKVDTKTALQHVLRGIHCPIDVGMIEFPDKKEVIYSFNSIHWGLASKVNVVAEKLRWMGNAIRYTTASIVELVRGETKRAKITLEDKNDGIIEYDEPFCLVIANNIGATLKGMKLAPHAKLNDGFFDLLLVRSSHTFDLLHIFKKMHDGTHTELPYVEYRQVKSFSITPYQVSKDKEEEEIDELIDIDGELKGSTPFKCTVKKKGN